MGFFLSTEFEVKKLLLLIICMLFLGCGSEGPGAISGSGRPEGTRPSGPDESEKALSVKASRVSRESISLFVISNTTFESIRDVVVYSKLNAIVSELAVEEGDTIRKGRPLAYLDDREIRNEFEQAKIAIDQAKVNLKQAQVRAELSAAEYERAKTLFEQKLISQQEFDQTALSSRTDTLAADEAKQQLVAAEARLEGAAIQLEYTTIESPLDGVVTERLVDVGDRVNVNEALFSVQEFPPLWARIYVPEKSLPELNVGQRASIEVETYPDQKFEGRIKMISPTVDASSGTVKVTIEVSRPGHYLRPGMFGTVLIATKTQPDALVIPKKAIVRERDLNFVYIINPDSTVSRQEIEIGLSEENRVEILSGLKEGDIIVSVGHETLNDGYLVAVKGWEGEVPEPFQPAVAPSSEEPPLMAERRDSGSAGERGGRGAGGGRGGFLQRLLQNPEIKKKYEARLAEDPGLATDPQKRRAFVREVMPQFRQAQGSQ
jgi:RND family efflux transporter MFP subunit